MHIQTNETLLETALGAFNRPYYLLAVSAAIAPAGSGMRQENKCYRLAYEIGGVRNSRAYKSYAEAKAELDRVTTPIVEITA